LAVIARVGGADLGLAVEGRLQIQVDRGFLVVDGRRLDVARADLGEHVGGLDRLVVAAAGNELGQDEEQNDGDSHPEDGGASKALTIHYAFARGWRPGVSS